MSTRSRFLYLPYCYLISLKENIRYQSIICRRISLLRTRFERKALQNVCMYTISPNSYEAIFATFATVDQIKIYNGSLKQYNGMQHIQHT
jgi:hypothetical protein